MLSPLSLRLLSCWRRHQCCGRMCLPHLSSCLCPSQSLLWEGDGDRCPGALGRAWQAEEPEEKRQLGEAWQYHLVGAASQRQPLPTKKGEKRTESREIKHSLSLLLTGIILYYSAICLVTATASAVQKSYKQPYGTSE